MSLLIRPPSSPQIGETVTEGDDSSVRSDVSGITSEIKKVEDAITTLKKILKLFSTIDLISNGQTFVGIMHPWKK